ncbi:MAG: DNA polymerase III subunit gamma/tau [Wenzhouxiangellaceae bacterium]|nr:DNA polymerase III subunit gamma/tau [Wenzhouxiangellaceae bacterium]
MSYQVLARKWRPRDFAGLVGQQHVVRALSNGLEQGRLHHAFLLTGTRGVGKTTIARILAKALNCERGVSAEPCGECAHCVAIDEGRFVDLLEIDAASRTRVDDTREILDNVPYAPARGRFKVYLIDEVHMLSISSFNALLKTLEEPPEHVKFVLATTDPQKIPLTILSRCLQFSLRRLQPDEIAGQMRTILDAEQLAFEPVALDLLARAADGSMRDGLSLLDQALAAGAGRIEVAAVEDMLGTVEQRHLETLVQTLVDNDPAAAMAAVAEVVALARDFGRLLAELGETLHRIALIQQVPDYRDESRTDWERLAGFAARLDPEDVQLYYQIALQGRNELGLAPSERCGCEMTLLRMFAFRPVSAADPKPDLAGSGSVVRRGVESGPRAAGGSSGTRTEAPSPAPAATVPGALPDAVRDAPPQLEVAVPGQPVTLSRETWPEVLAQLSLAGPVRSVAANLELDRADERQICFRHTADDQPLLSERFRSSLAHALEQWSGRTRNLLFEPVADGVSLTTAAARASAEQQRRQNEAEAALAADPVVRAMQTRLDAEIIPGSARPAEP